MTSCGEFKRVWCSQVQKEMESQRTDETDGEKERERQTERVTQSEDEL